MATLIHADIFFFVTTIIVVLLGIGAAVITYYVIQIMRKGNNIMDKIQKESENIQRDIEAVRTRIKEESQKVAPFAGIVTNFLFKKARASRRKTERKETSKDNNEE